MLLRLFVLLFLIYLGVRLFQRLDRFLTGKTPEDKKRGRGRTIPPRRSERFPADEIEDARWEDVS